MKLALLLLLLSTALQAEVFTYWIEPCTRPDTDCEAADEELAGWALDAWEKASDGLVTFERSTMSRARIRIFWVSNGNRGLYGEARAILVDGKPGAEIHVRPDLTALGQRVEEAGRRDRMFRHVIVYLTCLHEIGHGLGLGHTRSFQDVMYSFENGGDIVEYFSRYRRRLQTRADIKLNSGLSADDRKRLVAVYREPLPRETIERATEAQKARHK